MSFASFNYNVNFLYILIYWILEIYWRVTMYYYPKFYQVSDNSKENEYMYIIFPTIGKLLSGFMILYVYCVTKSKKQIKLNNQLINKKSVDKKNKYYYPKIFLITILELSARFCCFIYFCVINVKQEDIYSEKTIHVIVFLDVLARFILSIIMLKIKTYKHRLWSIYAVIIGFVLIIPFDILDIYYAENVNHSYIVSYFLIVSFQTIMFPLEDTLIKQFFNTFYILPEEMLFSVSVCEGIIMLLISLIFYFTNFITFDLYFSFGSIISILIYILTVTIKEYIIMKINYLFSSQSISFLIISPSLAVILIDIINFFMAKNKGNIKFHYYLSFPFEILASIIIFIATSVYDEFIIINKFELNLNVKKGIIQRAQLDLHSRNDTNDNLSIQSYIIYTEPLDEIIDHNDTINL